MWVEMRVPKQGWWNGEKKKVGRGVVQGGGDESVYVPNERELDDKCDVRQRRIVNRGTSMLPYVQRGRKE